MTILIHGLKYFFIFFFKLTIYKNSRFRIGGKPLENVYDRVHFLQNRGLLHTSQVRTSGILKIPKGS